MLTRRKLILLMVAISVFFAVGFTLARCRCPSAGIALSRERRDLHRLKNRTSVPELTDFDTNANLANILKSGDDRTRWSNSRAARLEGYVVAVGSARVELANCYVRRDIHIDVGLQPNAPPRERVVVEVTPRMRDWARQKGWDWSEARLKRDLVGRWCSFEGWLLLDAGHVEDAENTAPGKAGNWRASAWEIHPVTSFTIIK